MTDAFSIPPKRAHHLGEVKDKEAILSHPFYANWKWTFFKWVRVEISKNGMAKIAEDYFKFKWQNVETI